LETGFDSGSTLDYVYRNRASGITAVGKAVDWMYLNSIGWRGIRVRKQNVERLLTEAIARLRSEGKPVHIADIAAGHGRYVLDAIAGDARGADQIVFRDASDLNIERGTALIAERRLSAMARFEKGDAFDRKSLESMLPRPTLAVISGLYELFPENAALRESLAG